MVRLLGISFRRKADTEKFQDFFIYTQKTQSRPFRFAARALRQAQCALIHVEQVKAENLLTVKRKLYMSVVSGHKFKNSNRLSYGQTDKATQND